MSTKMRKVVSIMLRFLGLVILGAIILGAIAGKKPPCTCMGIKLPDGRCIGVVTTCTGLIDLCGKDERFCL